MFAKLCVVGATLCLLQVTVYAATEPEGAQCGGDRQSPIDIKLGELDSSERMSGIHFNRGFTDVPVTQQLSTDEHSAIITSVGQDQPILTGGPLHTDYRFHSLHFHWSTSDDRGSEHLVDGMAYPMEMHAVFTKNDLSFEESKRTADGLAVIGYFVEVSNRGTTKNNPFHIITKAMKKLTAESGPIDMTPKFPLSKLVVPFAKDFITYDGSLTTHDCNEVVTWIISPKILKITEGQLGEFRNLYDRGVVVENTNYRGTKPLNGRVVKLVK